MRFVDPSGYTSTSMEQINNVINTLLNAQFGGSWLAGHMIHYYTQSEAAHYVHVYKLHGGGGGGGGNRSGLEFAWINGIGFRKNIKAMWNRNFGNRTWNGISLVGKNSLSIEYAGYFNALQEFTNTNTNLAEEYVNKFFGHVKGLGNLYIDRAPEGYKLLDEGVFWCEKEKKKVGGVTVYLGNGISDVYISPDAMQNKFRLYYVLGHEMIHVAHRNYFREKCKKTHTEYSAYHWTYETTRKLYPKHPQISDFYLKLLMKEKQNRDYDYDKFGFSTQIPLSLWD